MSEELVQLFAEARELGMVLSVSDLAKDDKPSRFSAGLGTYRTAMMDCTYGKGDDAITRREPVVLCGHVLSRSSSCPVDAARAALKAAREGKFDE